jgi:HEAT repeat protein
MRVFMAVLMAGCLAAAQEAETLRNRSEAARRLSETAQRAAQGERDYERGQRALDGRRWDEAVAAFEKAAERGGSRADAALYWKAWSLNRLGRRDEALAALDTLDKSWPASRWSNDAKALELEVRQSAGQSVSPEGHDVEDLQLIAINSLIHMDPDRALPLLEKLLAESRSPRVKERTLFVLAQTNSPRARQALEGAARGGANPDLQVKAITYLALHGRDKEERFRILSEVYGASSDAAVKRAVLRGFMAAGAADRLVQAARTEGDPALRGEAVRLLGATKVEPGILEAMYGSEQDSGVRRQILNALAMKGDARALIGLARKETDPQLRKAIVERLSTMKAKEAADYMMEILNQ